MNPIEIQSLIDLYNQVERQQQDRLTQLFHALKERKGSTRRVEFGNGEAWTVNTLDPNILEKYSLPRIIEEKMSYITRCEIGEE